MKHRFLTVLTVVLAALCLPLSGPLLADAAHTGETTSFAPAALAPSALLTALTGDEIGAEERAFLDSQTDLFLSYYDVIPPAAVTCRAEGDGLRVTAAVYTTSDGVVWHPTAATLSEKTLALTEEGGQYTCLFPAAEADTAALSVRYTATLTVGDDRTATLCRYAFTAGKEASAMRADDEAAHARYTAAAEAYAAYLAARATYEEALARYETYLAEKRAYEQACAAYAAYCSAMNTYEQAVKDYLAYQAAMDAYKKDNAAYAEALRDAALSEDAYRAYLDYLSEQSNCRERLQVMSYLVNGKYRILSSLHGKVFADILAHRTELIAAGCAPEDFDTLSGEVIRLRELLDTYITLEGEETKYEFYRAHYTELHELVTNLSGAMYSLFGNPMLQAELNNRGKTTRYLQMAAQFYILSAWMDDSVTLDDHYGIQITLAGQRGFRDLAAMLDGISPIPPDTNQMDPTGHPYPAAVENPMPDLTPPVKPAPVRRPIAPEEVPAPGEAPAAVAEPQEPAEVDAPGEEPLPRVTDPLLLALADAVEAGRVREHSLPAGRTVTVESAVARGVSRRGDPVVSFYDADGKTLLAYVATEPGGTVSYPASAEPPFRDRDETYTYTFTGFVNEEGAEVSLTDVREDTAVYAAYRREERRETYTVRFSVDGTVYTVSCPYRTLPVCPVSTDKAPDDRYIYTFTGWDSRIVPATSDVTYTAQYTAVPRTYSVTFVTAAGETTVRLPYGESPVPPAVPAYVQAGILYRFAAWDTAPVPVQGDARYTACYTEETLIPLPGGGAADVTETDAATLTVESTGDRLPLASLFAYAAENGQSVAFRLVRNGAWIAGVTFPAADVAALKAAGAAFLSLVPEESGIIGTRACLSLTVETADGQTPAAGDWHLLLSFPYQGVDSEDAEIYRLRGSEEEALIASARAGILSVRLREGGRYALIERFPLSVTVSGKWNGAVSADRYRVAAGDWVTLTIQPGAGNRLDHLTVTRRTDGAAVPVDENGRFQMPADGVVITAGFAPTLYTVRFVNGDQIIEEGAYRRGDPLTAPTLPAYTDEDGVRWLFSGWSPVFSSIVTDDVTYTAVFRPATSPGGSGRNNNLLLTIYLPVAGGIVLLTVGTVLFLRHRRKRKK